MNILCSVIYVAAFLSLVVGELPKKIKEKVKKIHNKCQQDRKTYLDEYLEQRFFGGSDFSENVELVGPHFSCFFKKYGVQARNGRLNKVRLQTEIAKLFPTEVDALQQCFSDELSCGSSNKVATDLATCLRNNPTVQQQMIPNLPKLRLKMKQIHNECQQDPNTFVNGVTEMFFNLDLINHLDPDEIEQLGHHMSCLFMKYGVQFRDGSLDKKRLTSELARNFPSEVNDLKKCLRVTGSRTKKAFELAKCLGYNGAIGELFEDDRQLYKEAIQSSHKQCQQDPATYIDEALEQSFIDGQSVDSTIIGPHLFCIFKKLRLLYPDGSLRNNSLGFQIFMLFAFEEKAIEKCVNVSGTPNQIATDFGACLRNIPYFRKFVRSSKH